MWPEGSAACMVVRVQYVEIVARILGNAVSKKTKNKSILRGTVLLFHWPLQS